MASTTGKSVVGQSPKGDVPKSKEAAPAPVPTHALLAADEIALRGMIAQAERVVDAQIKATAESDRKTEQTMRLAILLFAFGLSIGYTFRVDLMRHPERALCGGGPLALGLLACIIAMYMLGHTYVALFGTPRFVEVIPNLEWLDQEATKLLDGKAGAIRSHFDSLFGGYAATEKLNQEYLDATTQGRRRAMQLLAAGLGLFILAGAYLAGAHFFIVHG